MNPFLQYQHPEDDRHQGIEVPEHGGDGQRPALQRGGQRRVGEAESEPPEQREAGSGRGAGHHPGACRDGNRDGDGDHEIGHGGP